MEHTFVAHRDDGTHMFNYSEWMGATTGVLLGNALHPRNERGVGPAAGRVGFAVASDMGLDVLREFWPSDRPQTMDAVPGTSSAAACPASSAIQFGGGMGAFADTVSEHAPGAAPSSLRSGCMRARSGIIMGGIVGPRENCK
jgi:hypothetical protein